MKLWAPVRDVFQRWFNEVSFTHSAAAAYYAVFSLPGLLLIMTAIASLVFDRTAVEDEVNSIIENLIGRELTINVQASLQSIEIMGRQWLAFLLGFAILLFAATRFFMQLQRSLNAVWGIKIGDKKGFLRIVKKRLASLILVLMMGFVLLVVLTMTSVLTLLSDYIALQIPYLNMNLMVILNWGLSYLIILCLFTCLYKWVPDVRVAWRSSMFGAAFASALFMVGQGAVNYYFSVADPQSVFGAAGSLILLMLWVSYAFMIVLLGAHISRVHMEYRQNAS